MDVDGRGGRAPGRTPRVGTALAALGAVLLVVAYTAVDWFDDETSSTYLRLHRTVTQLDRAGAAATLARVYFTWLGWVLLAAAVALAVAATRPTRSGAPPRAVVPPRVSVVLRLAGVLTGLGGAVVTVLAVRISPTSSYRRYLEHTAAGFYLALAGFLVTGVAALFGPERP